jgi:hypothetical protein
MRFRALSLRLTAKLTAKVVEGVVLAIEANEGPTLLEL